MTRFKASVIIPTKNPGLIFKSVLNAVITQKSDWPFEIIVIDSGSTDGTIDFIKSKPEVKLLEISPQDFGHGKTRNLAIKHASGEFLAVITHDAQPINNNWLTNLVETAEKDPSIAGVFGKHLAYPDASEFTTNELEQHFLGFSLEPLVRIDDKERYRLDTGYRQYLHFFSNNNALIRKSVWENIPYPEVDFAEDQAWAKKILESGYSKAYAEHAVVYHSHNYTLVERLQRSFDESHALKQLFGYILCPNLKFMITSMLHLIKRDIAYSKKIGLLKQSPLKVLIAILSNIMLVLGHYLGSHANKLPAFILRNISRDKRIFEQ